MNPSLDQTSYSLRHPGQRSNHRPRTVLVLGGGGMRGLAHVGVLRAMRTLGIEYDAIVGTSIGSLIGSMAAGGYSIEKIEALVSGIHKADYFRLNFLKFLMKGTRARSMYRGDTLREALARILPATGFRDLKVPFYCNSVRLETGGRDSTTSRSSTRCTPRARSPASSSPTSTTATTTWTAAWSTPCRCGSRRR